MTGQRESQDESGRTDDRRAVSTGLHVELCVRADAPTCVGAAQERVQDRLGDLRESGDVDAVTTSVWADTPGALDRDASEAKQHVDDRIARFREWASDRDVSLAPAFQTREMDSQFVDGRRERHVLPVLCLAVSDGDSLVAVYPHVDDGRVRTLEDGLDRLEDGTPFRRSDGERDD